MQHGALLGELQTGLRTFAWPRRMSNSLNSDVYFVSIRLSAMCLIRVISGQRSLLHFSLVIAYSTTRESNKQVFRSRQKARSI